MVVAVKPRVLLRHHSQLTSLVGFQMSTFMATGQSALQLLSLKPPHPIYGHVVPVHFVCPETNHECIVLAPQYANKYVVVLNVSTNEMKQIPYPLDFKPTDHCIVLDRNSGTLFVFGGFFAVFGALDLVCYRLRLRLAPCSPLNARIP